MVPSDRPKGIGESGGLGFRAQNNQSLFGTDVRASLG